MMAGLFPDYYHPAPESKLYYLEVLPRGNTLNPSLNGSSSGVDEGQGWDTRLRTYLESLNNRDADIRKAIQLIGMALNLPGSEGTPYYKELIVEIGAGNGEVVYALATKNPDSAFIGLDSYDCEAYAYYNTVFSKGRFPAQNKATELPNLVLLKVKRDFSTFFDTLPEWVVDTILMVNPVSDVLFAAGVHLSLAGALQSRLRSGRGTGNA